MIMVRDIVESHGRTILEMVPGDALRRSDWPVICEKNGFFARIRTELQLVILLLTISHLDCIFPHRSLAGLRTSSFSVCLVTRFPVVNH